MIITKKTVGLKWCFGVMALFVPICAGAQSQAVEAQSASNAAILHGDEEAAHDPTLPSPRLASALSAGSAELGNMRVRALVVGADDRGVALIGNDSSMEIPVRAGSVVAHEIDNVKLPLTVKSVSSAGVEVETAATENGRLFLPGGYRPLPQGAPVDVSSLRYLECSDVPLLSVLRLIADQTGENIAPSSATAMTRVSIFLRNVTAAQAVEEICRATGLWFRHDSESGIIRVTTIQEYQQSLASFREEQTETFTLLYPNVIEVASVIYGLYPERVMLSLGESELRDDVQNDLAERFSRFNAIADSGGADFMLSEPPTVASGASGGGTLSFNNGRIQVLRPENERRRGLSPDEAKLLSEARMEGETNSFERILGELGIRSASIFVTVSRKNNMLIVRTSDSGAMDDIRALIKRLDVQTPMVLLEVKILDLRLDDGFESGISGNFLQDYNTTSKDSQVRTQTGFSATEPPISGDGLSFRLLSKRLTMNLRLLEREGKVKTLATPMLLTANNEVSRLFIGEERPIVKNVTSQTIVTSEGNTIVIPQTEIEKENIGTLIVITPNINADKTVTLRLLQENSQIAGQTQIPIYSPTSGELNEASIDVVSSRSIAGTFMAQDGMLIAIGGLIQESEEERESRVPFLGRIPLLGWFFRSTEKVKLRSELIVMIKPHVLDVPRDGERLSLDTIDALSAHPARDGRSSMTILKESPPLQEKEMEVPQSLGIATNGVPTAKQ